MHVVSESFISYVTRSFSPCLSVFPPLLWQEVSLSLSLLEGITSVSSSLSLPLLVHYYSLALFPCRVSHFDSLSIQTLNKFIVTLTQCRLICSICVLPFSSFFGCCIASRDLWVCQCIMCRLQRIQGSETEKRQSIRDSLSFRSVKNLREILL
jgi:acyl-CoA synthetase (AMP-forming)/AMP-acid ligase II